MKNDNERIIDVDENPVSDSRPTEVPQISIERDASGASLPARVNAERGGHRSEKGIYQKKWGIVAAIAVLISLAAIGWYVYSRGSDRSDSGMRRMKDNISALSLPYEPMSKGIIPHSDSILGVAMDFYPLNGLCASLEWEFPDTADRSLVMFMRSADYHPDGRSLGPVVVDGVDSDNKDASSRGGYVAVSSAGKTVIGISLDDDVERWVRKNNGDFFRQMILLDDGELPRDFLLRGKVERSAIVSDVEDNLFYIVTRNKESMYDFADALREFGFVDAVYMTGGNAYSFYRDPDGNSHANSETLNKIEKYASRSLPQPLLVFRNAEL